ncbi:MAG: tetratricopeptide repeat protein [Thermodesulfobacteriota bacterium]
MGRILLDGFRFIPPLILWLLTISSVDAGAFDIQADDQYQYARILFEQQDYRQAAAEYQRFIHYFPDDSRADEAAYRIGISHYRSRDYRLAIRSFRRMIDGHDFGGPWFSTCYMISRCYLDMGETAAAMTVMNNLATITDDPDEKDAAHYVLGWIHLERLWAEGKNTPFDSFEASRKCFGRIDPASRDDYRLDPLTAELDQADRIPKKNPWVAGGLSIIPGGGQLYCGRYQDAVTALLVNTAFGIAAVESFDNELHALGGLISLVGLGFYAGNIYGAVSDAHKYNREQRRHFAGRLKALEVRFSVDKPFAFSLRYDF